jgi:hypothetical protein
MPAVLPNLRTPAIVAAALLVGYSAHAFLPRPLSVVEAQSRGSQAHDDPSNALAFQLSGIGPTSALTVYNPSDHTLYVYPAVTQGATRVSCSFMLHMSRPGAAIERQNCAPGSPY